MAGPFLTFLRLVPTALALTAILAGDDLSNLPYLNIAVQLSRSPAFG